MELKYFIKNALIDIISGVEEAKQTLQESPNNESLICGYMNSHTAKASDLLYDHNQGLYYRDIEFDVAYSQYRNSNGR